MVDVAPAWQNAVAAVLPSPFIHDLAISVSNDRSDDAAARWLIQLAADFLRKQGQPHGPIAAFDFAAFDIEAIGDVWPMMAKMAEAIGIDPAMSQTVTASLARFIADRLPAIWARSPWCRHQPVTRALALAERTHDLVGLFSVGLKPNGSKDPYALRRAANHWLMQVVLPVTVGRG